MLWGLFGVVGCGGEGVKQTYRPEIQDADRERERGRERAREKEREREDLGGAVDCSRD